MPWREEKSKQTITGNNSNWKEGLMSVLSLLVNVKGGIWACRYQSCLKNFKQRKVFEQNDEAALLFINDSILQSF